MKRITLFVIVMFVVSMMLTTPAFAKFCSKCGTKNEDGNKFCVSCGSRFSGNTAKQPDKPKIKPKIKPKPKPKSKIERPPEYRRSKEPLEHYLWGEQFLKLKDYDNAKDEFKLAIKFKENYPEAYYKLGYSYLKLQYYIEAEKTLEKAIELNPKNSDALYYMGLLHKLNGDPFKEREYYTKAVNINRKAFLALNNIGVSYIANKEIKKAQRYLKMSIDAKPDYWIGLNNLAVTNIYQKKYKRAREYLTKAHDLNPDFYLLYYNMGVIYEREFRYTEAMKQYENCLKIKPDHFESQVDLAAVLRRQKKLVEAEEILRKLTDTNIKCAEAWLNLSLIYNDLGREDDALDARNQANVLAPNYQAVEYDQGIAFGPKEIFDYEKYEPSKNESPKFSLKLYSETNTDLSAVNAITSRVTRREVTGIETAEERFAMGLKMLSEGKAERAISDFKQAIKLNKGTYPEAFEKIGVAYGIKGDFDDSIKFLEIGQKQDPKNTSILINLGKAYGIKRQYTKQITILKDLINIDKDYNEAYYHLGMAYVKKKDNAKAVKVFKVYLQKDPESLKRNFVEKMIRRFSK